MCESQPYFLITMDEAMSTPTGSTAKRREFLKLLTAGAIGAVVSAPQAMAAPKNPILKVWSCGGLAEAMTSANGLFDTTMGSNIIYTGAAAGPLAKALSEGSGEADVFGARTLGVAHAMRKSCKMLYLKPLCFSNYGIITLKGNPKKIKDLEDLTRKDITVTMAPLASAPGGQTVTTLLENAKLLDAIMPRVLDPQSTCVQRSVQDILEGKADVMVAEKRIVHIPRFAPYLEYVSITEEFTPAVPRVFTVGLMANTQNRELAEQYIEWITGPEGQKVFESYGFTHALSPRGQELIEKFGVHDV